MREGHNHDCSKMDGNSSVLGVCAVTVILKPGIQRTRLNKVTSQEWLHLTA
jgi:hypothetical protein